MFVIYVCSVLNAIRNRVHSNMNVEQWTISLHSVIVWKMSYHEKYVENILPINDVGVLCKLKY